MKFTLSRNIDLKFVGGGLLKFLENSGKFPVFPPGILGVIRNFKMILYNDKIKS